MTSKTAPSQSCTLVLRPVRPSAQLQPIALTRGKYRFGAAGSCDVVLALPDVAPNHGVFVVTSDVSIVKVWDDNTWLNGDLVESEAHPVAGDELTIGRTVFTIGSADEPTVSPVQTPQSQTETPELRSFIEEHMQRVQRDIEVQQERLQVVLQEQGGHRRRSCRPTAC